MYKIPKEEDSIGVPVVMLIVAAIGLLCALLAAIVYRRVNTRILSTKKAKSFVDDEAPETSASVACSGAELATLKKEDGVRIEPVDKEPYKSEKDESDVKVGCVVGIVHGNQCCSSDHFFFGVVR